MLSNRRDSNRGFLSPWVRVGLAGLIGLSLGATALPAVAMPVADSSEAEESQTVTSDETASQEDVVAQVPDTVEDAGEGTGESTEVLEPVVPEGLVADEGDGLEQVGLMAASATTTTVPGDVALGIINQERKKAGLSPLLNVQPMYDAALTWSTYMNKVNKFVHMYEVYDYRYQASFAKNAGWQLGGDLIGKGFSTEQQVANAWLNSTKHREWLMDKHGKMGAAGVAKVGSYWTLYVAGNPSKTGYVDRTPTGGSTVPAQPALTLSVSIAGKAASGSTLTMTTAVAGAGSQGVTESYSWAVAGKTIQSGKTLQLTNAQAGKAVDATYTVKDLATQKTFTKTAWVNVAEIPVQRVSGDCRYSTSCAVNKALSCSAKPVFIATGASFPDALSIGPAVAKLGGSLFLTKPSSADQMVINAIKAKNPSQIFIVGGTGAVSDNVANQLKRATGITPERIAGSNRYETSANIYKRFFQGQSIPLVFVATGRDYPDALSAAAAGGALGAPVVLVDGVTGKGMSADVISGLKKATSKAVIVGGEGAVGRSVQTNLAANFKVERLAGDSRYSTNAAVNTYIGKVSGEAVTDVWVATGRNFPDALSAAAPAGDPTQRLVLSNGACIPGSVVSKQIKTADSKVAQVNLVGGTGALSSLVASLTECK